MTKLLVSAARRCDTISLTSSPTYWAEVLLPPEAFNAANRFHNGSQSPIPPMAAGAKSVYVFATSRRAAVAFAGAVNNLLAAKAGVYRMVAVAA